MGGKGGQGRCIGSSITGSLDGRRCSSWPRARPSPRRAPPGAVMLARALPSGERVSRGAPGGGHREPAAAAVGRLRGPLPGGALLPGSLRPAGGHGGPEPRGAPDPRARARRVRDGDAPDHAPDPASRGRWSSVERSGPSLGVLVARGLLGNALRPSEPGARGGPWPARQRLLELLERARGGDAGGGAGRPAPAGAGPGEAARGGAAGAGRGGRPAPPIRGMRGPLRRRSASAGYAGVRVYDAAQFCERVLRRIPVHVLRRREFAFADELTPGTAAAGARSGPSTSSWRGALAGASPRR